MRSGIDVTALDPAVRPQDDLYRHVNQRWWATHEIPADRSMDGALRALHDQAEEHVRAIIEDLGAGTGSAGTGSAEAGSAGRIGRLYASFMAEDEVEARGTGPIAHEVAAIDDARDHDELALVLAALQRTGGAGAVGLFVDVDAKDVDRPTVHLYQSGLGLPDEAYYREEQYVPVREAYRAHVARMLALTGLAGEADAVLSLESALAAHHWDVVRDRDADLTYNPMTFAGLVATAPGFPWEAWADALGLGPEARQHVVVREPSYLTGFAAMWPTTPLATWQSWLRYHLVTARAPYLTRELVEANFDFHGRTLTGAPEVRARWKRGVALVEGALGEAVGQVYVERHFPPGHKAAMEALVANLVAAYREAITELDWMGPETRAKALAKLEKFTPKIGYPDRWKSYDGLEISATDLVGNVRRSHAYELDRELAKIGEPVDRTEWFMTPQTVNAYFHPGMNEIVFPAAILQPPFFSPEVDDAANYGGIGAVIGHEIGHGFDDQGSKYDGDGRLEDWWTEADRAEFERRADALIAQYDAYRPRQLADGPNVNGAFTVGENIGDLGGLSIALRAYRLALATDLAEAPVIDGLTGVQRALLSWAQAWRSKGRDEEVVRRLAVDPHAPDEFRCNGVVRNLPEFHEAFDVRPGDELYLAPEERVRIW